MRGRNTHNGNQNHAEVHQAQGFICSFLSLTWGKGVSFPSSREETAALRGTTWFMQQLRRSSQGWALFSWLQVCWNECDLLCSWRRHWCGARKGLPSCFLGPDLPRTSLLACPQSITACTVYRGQSQPDIPRGVAGTALLSCAEGGWIYFSSCRVNLGPFLF